MMVNLSYFYTCDFVDLQIPFEFYKVSESSFMNGLTYNQILLHTILPRVQKNLFDNMFNQEKSGSELGIIFPKKYRKKALSDKEFN